MTKYKTKDGRLDGVIPNVGVIVNGYIETDVDLEGANFEAVTEATPEQAQVQPVAPIVGVASQANPDLNLVAAQTVINEGTN